MNEMSIGVDVLLYVDESKLTIDERDMDVGIVLACVLLPVRTCNF